MTITMILEIEGISFDTIPSVLSNVGAGYSIEQEYFTGNFDCSNCYFVFRPVFPDGGEIGGRPRFCKGNQNCSSKHVNGGLSPISLFPERMAVVTMII